MGCRIFTQRALFQDWTADHTWANTIWAYLFLVVHGLVIFKVLLMDHQSFEDWAKFIPPTWAMLMG